MLQIKTAGFGNYLNGNDGGSYIKALVIGEAGSGKALDVDAKVMTPTGPVRNGDLQVGDLVIGSTGAPTPILGVYDQGERPAYRFTRNDGAEVICDEEHVWDVKTQKMTELEAEGKPTKRRVLSVRELLDQGVRRECPGHKPAYKFFLPLTGPVQFDKVELPVHPYLLGALLANGSLVEDGHPRRSFTLTTNDAHIPERIAALSGIAVAERAPASARRWAINPPIDGERWADPALRDALVSLDVWNHGSREKYVPDLYMHAHEEARRELLAGLIDCDGSVGPRRRAKYDSSSERLALNVRDLVRSLGGMARTDSTFRGDRDGYMYTTTFWLPDNPFTLPRKAQNYSPRPWRSAIESIEPVGTRRTRCIKVAADDSLYVAGDYLVTHNTPWAARFPRPIFADCEDGMMSVADLGTPYARVRTSADMDALLDMLRRECMKPPAQRRFDSFVIDTIDSYQKLLISERTKSQHRENLSGWADWGWLDAKMQQIVEAILNLPLNVAVLMHIKTVEDQDVDGNTIMVTKSSLKGDLATSIWRYFDLIGMTESSYEAVDGERTLTRRIRWASEPKYPMLRDRSAKLPKFTSIDFAETDFTQIFNAITGNVDDLPESKVLGELETEEDRVEPVEPAGQGGPVANPEVPAIKGARKTATKTAVAKKAAPSVASPKAAPVSELTSTTPPSVSEPSGPTATTPEQLLKDELGAEVVEEIPNEAAKPAEAAQEATQEPEKPAVAPSAGAPANVRVCGSQPVGMKGDPVAGCGVELTKDNATKLGIAQLKTKTSLCDSCLSAFIAG